MNKQENKFLGLLISISDEKDCFRYDALRESSGYSEFETIDLLNVLTSYEYIKQISMNDFHITARGKSAYISPKKKLALSFFKNSYLLLKFAITYVLGIISGFIIAYLTHKFGWQ